MQITKAIFDQIAPNEIFWIVITRLLSGEEGIHSKLTYVCTKGKSGQDWGIRSNLGSALPDDIARYGQEVRDLEQVRFLCPCDDEVLQLYNQ